MLPTQFLINKSNEIAAEYNENTHKLIIHDSWLKSKMESGITVTSSFRSQHKCGWVIYPTSEFFVQAFRECAFIHGLQQMGYKWREKNEFDGLSIETLANKIVEWHKNGKDTHTPLL